LAYLFLRAGRGALLPHAPVGCDNRTVAARRAFILLCLLAASTRVAMTRGTRRTFRALAAQRQHT